MSFHIRNFKLMLPFPLAALLGKLAFPGEPRCVHLFIFRS